MDIMSVLYDLLEWLQSIFDSLFGVYFNKSIHFENSNISIVLLQANNNNDSGSIGEGAFSIVLKGINSNSEYYAVKKMLAQSNELLAIANTEIESYNKFKHKNILQLLDSTIIMENNIKVVYLLFPYMEYGSLRDVLSSILEGQGHRPSIKQILTGFHDICEAVNLLHSSSPSFIHQDIKPENILIGVDGCPYLIDFGSVRKAEVKISTRKDAIMVAEEAAQYCTAPFRAPELWDPPKDCVLDTRTDVWSLGCLLFAWWFGYSPYECEFSGSTVRVVDCTSLRVLAPVSRPEKPTPEDLIILSIVEWILEKDYHVRPYTSDIIEKIKNALTENTHDIV